jgi:hypothetical protein
MPVRGFFINLVLAFLADFFAFLGVARFVSFLATAFRAFPRFDVLPPDRLFCLAIAAALFAAITHCEIVYPIWRVVNDGRAP